MSSSTACIHFATKKPLFLQERACWGEGTGPAGRGEKRWLVCLLPLLLAALPAHAQSPLPEWEALSAEQREHLIAPLRDRWNSASPEQRTRMLARAERWQQMEPGQRQRISGAIGHLQELPPIRHHELRALFHYLHTLPQSEHAGFMLHWHNMSPEQRREWEAAHPAPSRGDSSRRRPEQQRTGHEDSR